MCIASRDLYFDRMWKYPRVFRSWREEVDAIEGPPAPHYFYERPVDSKLVTKIIFSAVFLVMAKAFYLHHFLLVSG